MGQFGDKFRKAREARELTLDDVSNVIKISPRMLQAIEEENFDRLPGGVFNKGFIRAYAKHLGLGAEEAVNEYLECVRQAQAAAQQTWDPAMPGEAPSPANVAKDDPKPAIISTKAPTPAAVTRAKAVGKSLPTVEVEDLAESRLPREKEIPPTRKAFIPPPTGGSSPWKLIVVAVLVFVAGIALWTNRSRTVSSVPPPPKATTASSTPASSPGQGAMPSQPPAGTASASAPPMTSATLLQSPAANSQPQELDVPAVTAPTPSPSSADIAGKTAGNTEEKNDVTVRTFGKAAPAKAVENAGASFAFTIRATENSWLSVIADGQPIRQETLIAPAHTSVHATREVVVKVGNAAGVSFILNGKEIPPQGNEGEAKTLVFDSSGLKTAP